MDSEAGGAAAKRKTIFHHLAAWGPGLLVMLADTDAGNVVTAAQAGARWNFRLLPLILALIPALYLVQELAARLGLFAGQGFGEMVRARFGRKAALLALAGLALATFGTLVTEFTGVAGIGELYGLPRDVSLPFAAFALLAVAATGSYRRVEQGALSVGLFECAFLDRRLEGAAPSDGGGPRFFPRPDRRSGFPVSGRRHRRLGVQPLDDLLPAGGHRAAQDRAGRVQFGARRHGGRRGPDPGADRRGSGRGGGGALYRGPRPQPRQHWRGRRSPDRRARARQCAAGL